MTGESHMTALRTTRLAAYALVSVLLVSGAFAAQTRLVQEGDNITFRRSTLTSEDNVLTISWSQGGEAQKRHVCADGREV